MIGPTDKPILLDREVWRQIRRQARQLIGKAGFRPADREDIEQELALRVWRSFPNFNPEAGCSAAFVATVLGRAANSLLRLRNSRKRGNGRQHRSLAIGHKSMADGFACDAMSHSICSSESSHEDKVDLAHDVAAVMAQLPAQLRKLAERLKHDNIASIARHDSVSRSTIYARLAELRRAFVAADLKNLSQASYTSRAFCEVNR
jgi:RNA polymerase sigma factor (sigma-70 family)